MRFKDIPQLTQSGSYRVNVGWGSLENTLKEHVGDLGLDLDPDFQRGHVWNEAQQIRYCEWILRGGKTGRELLLNCPGWNQGSLGKAGNEYVLVDGKQRLTAVLRFLRSEILVFGKHYFKDFTDNLRIMGPDFVWCVNDLRTRAEVLQWYLDMNTGGTVHADDEIERVRKLLDAEERTYYPTKAHKSRKYITGPLETGKKEKP